MSRGRWYWFECRACRWGGIRYRNTKKCPKCRHDLIRWRQAKQKELERSIEESK